MLCNDPAISLAGAWLGTLAPPTPCKPSEFAERVLTLPPEANAIAGPLKLHKYQRDMLDAINAPDVTNAALMCAAQVGKSLTLISLMSYFIGQEPCPLIFASPTDGANAAFVKERLDPMIAASPALRALVGANNRADNASLKIFPGGYAAFCSSYKTADLAARACRVVIADEVDRFALSTSEGAPLALVARRTATFSNRKIVSASTPTSRINSRIKEQYDRGNKMLWHISCPHCGTVAPLTFNRLVWPDGEPQNARLACLDCSAQLTERERLDSIERGDWVATATGEPGHIGFHCSAIISPFVTMESIAREREAADTPDKLRVFVNTIMGEVFDETAEVSIDGASLKENAEHVAQPYSKHIQFVTCGVDVQGNRLECTVLAHWPRNQRLVLDHFAIPGDTSGDTPWSALDDFLGRPLRLEDGRAIPIAATGVDSGFSTTKVAQFVASQRSKMRRVYALKGMAGFGRAAIKEGARIGRGITRVWICGVDDLKLSVTKALALPSDAPNSIRLPAHLPDDYFEGLASEQLQTVYRKSGHMSYQWQKITPNIRNESLDCLNYAVAVASLVRSPPSATNQITTPKLTISSAAARLRSAVNASPERTNNYA